MPYNYILFSAVLWVLIGTTGLNAQQTEAPLLASNQLLNQNHYIFKRSFNFQDTTQRGKQEFSISTVKPSIPKNWNNKLFGLNQTQEQKVIQVGALLHLIGVGLQDRTTAAQDADPNFQRQWQRQLNVYRARILVGANISEKTSFFMETEIPSIIGRTDSAGNKNMQVSPIILDAQVEHIFNKHFSLIAGMQLEGVTRNALQSAASLMGLDFGYFQYPYNLFTNSPLQGNFGRDIGLQARGFFFNDRLEYRLGAFSGRNFDQYSPLRIVGRLNFNILDREKDFYYTGTTLGQGKLWSIGGGFDIQGTYQNYGIDMFLDLPLGNAGSLTVQTAFNYMTGGNSANGKTLTRFIPTQTIHFVEIGYYFHKAKLQPFFKYENQIIDGTPTQFGLPATVPSSALRDFNTLNGNMRIGGGLNYYFAGYNTNLKLIYEQVSYGRLSLANTGETASRGEVWLQLQFFIF